MKLSMKRLPLQLRSLLGILLMITLILTINVIPAKADTSKSITQGDFGFTLSFDPSGSIVEGICLNKYTGSSKEVALPASVTYGGTSYPDPGGGTMYVDLYFTNSKDITRLAIPNGFEQLMDSVSGCEKLEAIAIGDSVRDIDQGTFAGCPNLKEYYFSGNSVSKPEYLENTGIGQDKASGGKTYPGITVWTKKGSSVDTYIKSVNAANEGGNQISLKYSDDPYGEFSLKKDDSSDNDGSDDDSGSEITSPAPGSGKDPAKILGKDNTPLGKGASIEAADKFITSYSKENDPPGSKFSVLQLRTANGSSKLIKLKWNKVNGAKKYVIYGAKCGSGKAARFVKISEKLSSGLSIKKINKKALVKGKYYKFIVAALDKNNKVISTSKIVHAVVGGGKYENARLVSVKTNSNLSLKVKKTFKIKAAATARKSIDKKHKAVSYESSKPSVATVSKTGKITGKKAGTCYIYAYAHNGKFKKIKVTVKKK